MKRIIVCADGTWNTADQNEDGIPTPTNVVRLYNAVAEHDANGVEQRKYYHPGVGTAPGLWDKLAGGGMGAGLDRNIMSGYRYLADNYETGDEIYLFGFSRGAYTVRSLAGMVGKCGLLDPKGLEEREIWSRVEAIYEDCYRGKGPIKKKKWDFHKPPARKDKIPIHFLGVWDTVGALGIPDDMALLNLLDKFKDRTFHDTELGKNVVTARHAVAMDEQRASFQPTLWTKSAKGSDVTELWFPGVHSDVGGGYVETGLSDGALDWMIKEAMGTGKKNGPALAFDEGLLKQVRPNHHDVLHNSMDGVFAMLPSMPRSAPNLSDTKQPLHASARDRYDDPPITQAPYYPTQMLKKAGDSKTVSIYAIQPWNCTGIYLEAGKTYKMTAEGEWVDKGVTCGPDGADDGNFQLGEIAHVMGSALGKLEGLFKQLGGNESANFVMTRRHEKFPWFCLVGAVANGVGADKAGKVKDHETKKIGNGCTWTPKKSGYLYAYANDAWRFYDNNKGSVRLTVTRS